MFRLVDSKKISEQVVITLALVGKVVKMRRADAPLICQIKSGWCRDGLWCAAGL